MKVKKISREEFKIILKKDEIRNAFISPDEASNFVDVIKDEIRHAHAEDLAESLMYILEIKGWDCYDLMLKKTVDFLLTHLV